MQYCYQNVWVEQKDSLFVVFNENFFTSLDNLVLEWHMGGVRAKGPFGHGGTIDISGIGPQQRRVIDDAKLMQTIKKMRGHHQNDELLLTFRFKARQAMPLIDKDQELAHQQFVMNAYRYPQLKAETAQVEREETNTYVKLQAAGTTLFVGKHTGWIDFLDVDDKPMLSRNISISPEFWRAPTDNDYGARLQQRFATWKNPNMRVTNFQASDNQVNVSLAMPDQKATLNMTYALTAKGEVLVREQMTVTKGEKVSNLFRYGMQLQMPGHYDRIRYYGRGPVENYCDRNNSQLVGQYEGRVPDQYYEYVRPQESGNHTDVRWFDVMDADGRGLRFCSNAPMEASALPYLTEQLDDGVVKDKAIGRHSGDLVHSSNTHVHIQQRQMGLGCVNSWGAWPRPEYCLPYQDYDFSFLIQPLRPN